MRSVPVPVAPRPTTGASVQALHRNTAPKFHSCLNAHVALASTVDCCRIVTRNTKQHTDIKARTSSAALRLHSLLTAAAQPEHLRRVPAVDARLTLLVYNGANAIAAAFQRTVLENTPTSRLAMIQEHGICLFCLLASTPATCYA